MNDERKPGHPVSVSCETCLKEVPSSEAKMEEANDYVLYFCGLDCYRIWREKKDRESV